MPAALLAFYVHDLSPFVIRFTETIGIRYYGLAYLLGFLGCAWLLNRYHRAGRSPVAPAAIWDLMTYLILGVLVGGRLGSFLLYHPADLLNPPWAFFMIWKGGMASHGGFIGVIVALAGLRSQPHQVTSFGLALEALERQPTGSIILSVTACGLAAFGAFSFVEARFRRIRPPRDLKPG